MLNLIYFMDHILFQTYKVILGDIIKKHEIIANNPPLKTYVNIKLKIGFVLKSRQATNRNKIRIVFETKTCYKLELLSLETIKLLRNTKKEKC